MDGMGRADGADGPPEPERPDDDDVVFRALAEPRRRRLMDALHAEDGQSLTQLCGVLPELTRFGVMKHLTVLADAELVVTEKIGRTRHHYLNPVPIQRIHRRWLAKYAEGASEALLELAAGVEQPRPPDS